MFDWRRKARERRAHVEADVVALMASVPDPYSTARARERASLDVAEAKHWSSVAVAVAKRSGKAIGLDTATRMVDADPHKVRITVSAGKLRVCRLRFIGPGAGGPRVVDEREIHAPTAGAAMEVMIFERWPPKSTWAQLIDLDGTVLTERTRR